MYSFNKTFPTGLFNIFNSSNPNRDYYFRSILALFEDYINTGEYLIRQRATYVISQELNQDLYSFNDEVVSTDISETVEKQKATAILNGLVNSKWLDTEIQLDVTYYLFPNYSYEIIEAIYKIVNPDEDETINYVYSIYSSLKQINNNETIRNQFRYLEIASKNAESLSNRLSIATNLIKEYFGMLQELTRPEDLLNQHFNDFIDNVVKPYYHRLKTEDNVYRYKNDILTIANKLLDDHDYQDKLCKIALQKTKIKTPADAKEYVYKLITKLIKIIVNLDKKIDLLEEKQNQYVHTTLQKIDYLQKQDRDLVSNLSQMLMKMTEEKTRYQDISERIKLTSHPTFNQQSLYMNKKAKRKFCPQAVLIAQPSPSKPRKKKKYSKKQVLNFVNMLLSSGIEESNAIEIINDETYFFIVMTYYYGVLGNDMYAIEFDGVSEYSNRNYKIPQFKIIKKEK
ncbi:Wadjet anti-phage system protein JetA family protein [Beduini massiliensis]|uniref:Wadjet anti-phage system protein JetA family protein n=1 Tax=Beduini massiliensis TaxID=1585974 RepID=UPI00059A8566|nr:Wadjet anti-phage system protein JetA family protein [Beduini massiliensis]